MQYLTVNQIRDKFLDFFAEKQHHKLPSFPLVPQNDNSLLFINAGMTPMKAFFTGQETPPSVRVATCQKCIRTIDIDDVGKKARYGSFFEMLGNFSFGEYFKSEVIPWAWEFLTEVLQFPTEKLFISIYEDDDEAFEIWNKNVGIPAEKIYRLGKDDNFWEHGTGPCGPCSEIHFDRGAENGCGKPDCAVGCDCDRFLEIWNLVFIQFERREDGSYAPLARTGIDTGMGLERMAIVMQNAASIFEIDNIKAIRDKGLQMAGIANAQGDTLVSANIIADHVRSVAFMAADGVLPSNEGRGYVFRRLLRRAVRHGKAIGLTHYVCEIARVSIASYSHAYPELSEKSEFILKTLESEETRFLETLDTGINLLQKHIDTLKSEKKTVLSGADVFKLYDTFGFPPDLTREILEDNGLGWDEAGFDKEMADQKDRARRARGESTYMGADETVYHKLPPGLPTEFVGYTEENCEATVLAIIADGEIVQEASAKQKIAVVLDRTPFYAASGGQVGDIGTLDAEGIHIHIDDCINVAGNNTVHIGEIQYDKTLKVGQTVTAAVTNRAYTSRNHTATHLLQRALRDVLGNHVEQAGSYVSPDRLRFDFTHIQPLTAEERERVEEFVNFYIDDNLPVITEITTPEEARKKGAMALFGEKYGDTVRMVSITDKFSEKAVSIELCGGTHVKNTAEIGLFRIISETGIAAGVRRIEAETSRAALCRYRQEARALAEAASILKTSPHEVPAKLTALYAENRDLKKELAKIQQAAAGEQQGAIIENILKSAETVNNFTLITALLENYDIESLRTLCDKLKTQIKSGCLLLCGVNAETGAAMFLASATDDAVKSGINCGTIVKQAATICGGGGGGRPNHAQAGGKDAAKATAALTAGLTAMKETLA